MPRFFVENRQIDGDIINIVGDDARHIARALRMAVGDEVTVSDGSGTVFECQLTKIRDDICECRVIKSAEAASESPISITLFMAFPKGDKLETVVQKAVELGVSRIVPFESSRCIKRPKAEKIDKQTQRYTRIAHEAAKQCGRAILPTVAEPLSFDEMLNEAAMCELTLFCYEGDGAMSLRVLLEERAAPKTLGVIVGSEGGFSETEAEMCASRGFATVNLGPRIMRCETAPSYVLSSVSYRFEL
jgi:16S rRNA (uracil1498-N3)-methyltransferase